MSEQKQILKNSRIMVVMTSASRVFGLIRDQMTAFLLGTTRLGDIWAMAFMIPNLFRRLIAEGAMTSSFVPLLAELSETEQERATHDFIRSFFSLILLLATLIVTLMVLLLPRALPFLLTIAAPAGDAPDPELYAHIVLPTQLMFPYLIFISLAAVCQGVLNVNNRFALAAATPIVLNICIIGFGYSLRNWHDNPIWGMCVGVLCGGFFQFALQWLRLHQLGFRLAPILGFWNQRTREAARLWLPTTFSAGVVQINALISTMIAINLLEGAAIALQSSNRLIELVLGVFTVALSTSMLPVLAKQRSRNDHQALQENLWTGLSTMSMITIPAALGLMLAGRSVIALLFQHGAFDQRSLDLTASALVFHGMALVPISWYRITSQTFYAFKRVRLAVVIAAIGAAVNISGCLLLPRFFQADLAHCGIALATLISSWVLFLLGISQIRARFQLTWPSRLNRDLTKICISALAFVPIWLPIRYHTHGPGTLVFKVLASILVYILFLKLLAVSGLPRLIRKK